MKPKVEKPRLNEFIIDKKPNPFKEREKVIKSVRLEKISINDQYEEDIKNNKGFLITNEESVDRKENKTIDGLFSPKYGIDVFSDNDLDNAYRCACGEYQGAINVGDMCEKCNTPVQFCDSDLTISGYIPLGKFKVINPSCYIDLESLIGKKELINIIKFSNKYALNGHNISLRSKKSPYMGIGLMKFYEMYEEIITYYRDKRKDKIDYYNNLQRFKHAVFTNYVNPYSALLRPLINSNDKVCVFEVNKLYGAMLVNANIINSNSIATEDVIVENSLFEIQKSFNEVFNFIVKNELSGKNGLFRGKLNTARIDCSSRMVVVPGVHLKTNEIDLPYAAGIELLRLPLIRELSKIDNINIRQANLILDEAARKFSKRIWILMNWILQKSKFPPRMQIQRSPSLLLEAVRMMRIRSIKMDFYDLTMSVPVGILQGLNADFDGDVFSAWMVYDKRLIQAWEVHDPANHFMCRYTGGYSELAGFIKDSCVILSELWELGKTDVYYEEWASDSEREKYRYRNMDC